MLHIFSTNRVKLTTRKPKATDNLTQMEYIATQPLNPLEFQYSTALRETISLCVCCDEQTPLLSLMLATDLPCK